MEYLILSLVSLCGLLAIIKILRLCYEVNELRHEVKKVTQDTDAAIKRIEEIRNVAKDYILSAGQHGMDRDMKIREYSLEISKFGGDINRLREELTDKYYRLDEKIAKLSAVEEISKK